MPMPEARSRRPGGTEPSGGLVAEARGDGNFVAALGPAAVEHSLTGLGLHTGKEAVNLGAMTAVGLEGALGHCGDLLLR